MFHKMKVTGPQCAEFITQPLQAMRELNPTLNTMIQSTEQMNKVLCEAAKQPLKKRRKIASSAVALHDAHLQRLKALKSDSDHTYDPLFQALAQQPATPSEAPPTPGEEEDESSLGSRAAMQRVMEAIPKQYRAKAATLGSYLKAHPNLIRFTSAGRPILQGTEMRNANIMDIVRSLYVWPKGNAHPRGTKEVVEALYSIGVPSFVLSNAAVRAVYHRLDEAAEQFRTEEQERAGAQEQQEQEGEEEEQEPEGEEEEQETSTLFETPLHSAIPPLATIPKVEERMPTMIPKLQRKAEERVSMITKPPHIATVTMPARQATSKVSSSGIPATLMKHEAGKSSTSQTGKGRMGIAEHAHSDVHLPGKPIRILRLSSISSLRTKSMKREARKPSGSQTGQDFGCPMEHMYDDPRLPGKPIRILRLY